ncbi:8604_t:CDS:2 [Ambispora gerdemannii]|uniref:8604_t:CDS:1 n=1 Tax=Ambispora gerdemannii TaxID=144530 RepID=A0A9N8V2S6_9GLOM|nr:8604_t:CDS:2 [Ambispora gerdemannii]
MEYIAQHRNSEASNPEIQIASGDTQPTIIIDESESTGASGNEIRLKIDEFYLQEKNPSFTSSNNDNNSVSLAWRNLSYTVMNSKTKQKTNIVQDVSGVVKPGEVMAIMGPSGSGKSTLLDLLAGRKEPKLTSGEIYLNGRPGQVKYVSTYVMQEDALMGVLTVRENIQFAADLCFPSSYSAKERKARVRAIITEFGLDRVADSKIGTVFVRGVSGGEKRRASIATQVLTLPKIIFLDEPTSGLDSAASYNVMKAIVQMARNYKLTVIASIHQPSTETYSLFDKLCILGRGRTLYMGKREKAIAYFQELGHVVPPYSNPADHFLYLINSDFMTDKTRAEEYITNFIVSFEKSDANKLLQEEIKSLIERHKEDTDTRIISSSTTTRYQLSFFKQTSILLKRSFINSMRNILVFWVRVILYVALGLLIGTTYWRIGYDQINIMERFSGEYFSVAFLSFMSIAGIPGFLEERLVFQRERGNGFYSVGPFVLANTIISFPFIFIISLSFTAVIYPTVGLHNGGKHVILFVVYLFLCLNVAEGMVVFIASLVPIFIASLALTAFANGFWMVFGGYLVRPHSIAKGWKWAHYIDYQKYAFEAILSNDLKGLDFNCERLTDPSPDRMYNCYYGDKSGRSATFPGEAVLEELGYTNIRPALWAVILIAMTFVFRLAFFAVLRFKKNHN